MARFSPLPRRPPPGPRRPPERRAQGPDHLRDPHRDHAVASGPSHRPRRWFHLRHHPHRPPRNPNRPCFGRRCLAPAPGHPVARHPPAHRLLRHHPLSRLHRPAAGHRAGWRRPLARRFRGRMAVHLQRASRPRRMADRGRSAFCADRRSHSHDPSHLDQRHRQTPGHPHSLRCCRGLARLLALPTRRFPGRPAHCRVVRSRQRPRSHARHRVSRPHPRQGRLRSRRGRPDSRLRRQPRLGAGANRPGF